MTMENVYLGYETAWWYWRNAKNAPQTLEAAKRSSRLKNYAFSKHTVMNALGASVVFSNQDLSVLVNKRATTNTQHIAFRHCPPTLPKGSLVQLSEHVFIASPELSFLQYAAEKPLVDALRYGTALCGTFVHDPATKYGIAGRASLTSTKALSVFLGKCSGMRGIVAARKALPHVVDKSASPREIAVSLLLKLPLRLGGYALPPFTLNHEFKIAKELNDLTQRKTLRADFCWKEHRLVAEYDSDAAHLESEELYNDATKRIAFHRMGYKTFSFTRLQVDSLQRMDQSVAALRRELNVPAPKHLPPDYRKRQIALRCQLGLSAL